MTRCHLMRTLMALVIVAPGAPAFAAIIVPPTLNPGDQYRLAFVSSTTRNASSTLIDDYNDFIDLLGDTVIASDWKAIASTEAVDARTNTGTDPNTGSGVPIFLLDGSKLADNNADLWDGSIDVDLSVTEGGVGGGHTLEVWTGTAPDGTAHAPSILGDRTGLGTTEFPSTGFSIRSDASWVDHGLGFHEDALSLYGISSVLSVPASVVPEPGTFTMFAFGVAMLMGAGGYRRWRASELS